MGADTGSNGSMIPITSDCIQSLARRSVVEPTIGKNTSDVKRKGRDVVEEMLDRVALRFCYIEPDPYGGVK